MFVAVARLILSLPDSGSLKSKRHVVHKVLDKVRARFNVAAAEVADLDLWQRATLGFAVVANDHSFAQECLDKVVRFVAELHVAQVDDVTTEIIPLGRKFFGEDVDRHGAVRTLADAEREAAGGAPLPEQPRAAHSTASGQAGRERQRGNRRGRADKRPLTAEERTRALEDLRRRLREARRAAAPPDAEDGD